MQTATDSNAQRTSAIFDALVTARDAIRSLEKLGITVIAVTASERRPTLFIDRMPDGVECVTKRHSPTGMGREVIRAAPWQGCQLETMHVEAFDHTTHALSRALGIAEQVVENAITMPRLQLVPRG